MTERIEPLPEPQPAYLLLWRERGLAWERERDEPNLPRRCQPLLSQDSRGSPPPKPKSQETSESGRQSAWRFGRTAKDSSFFDAALFHEKTGFPFFAARSRDGHGSVHRCRAAPGALESSRPRFRQRPLPSLRCYPRSRARLLLGGLRALVLCAFRRRLGAAARSTLRPEDCRAPARRQTASCAVRRARAPFDARA